jgi:hypothetical protein
MEFCGRDGSRANLRAAPPTRNAGRPRTVRGLSVLTSSEGSGGLVVLLFTALCTGALALMAAGEASSIFMIAFALGDLVLIGMLVELWLGSTRVVADARGLTVRRRWGLVKRGVSFTAGEITGIEPEIGVVYGSRAYYDLKVSASGGRQGTAGTMIRHKREAEWLAGQLRSALKPAR